MRWLLSRLSERSTWVAGVGAATALGLNLKPDQAESIVTVGILVGSALLALTKG